MLITGSPRLDCLHHTFSISLTYFSDGLLDGVGDVMGILRSCAVLAAVGVAVFRTMFIVIFGPADSHTGSVAMGVAMAGPVLVAMLSLVVMAVLSGVLVTMVALVGSHEILQFIETV